MHLQKYSLTDYQPGDLDYEFLEQDHMDLVQNHERAKEAHERMKKQHISILGEVEILLKKCQSAM